MDAEHAQRGSRRWPVPRLTRGRVLAGIGCLLGGAIAVNATLFQTGRHPAPMFRTLAKPVAAKSDLPLPPLRSDIRDTAEKASSRSEKSTETATAGETLLREVQSELAMRGYYKGEADGKAGPATVKAIKDFQFDRRMPADGIANDALLAEVRSSQETMKDELYDLVKRANAPERGDKPMKKAEGAASARKPEPAAQPKPVSRDLAAKPAPAKTAAAKDATKAKDAPKAKTEAKPAPKATRVAEQGRSLDARDKAKASAAPARSAQAKSTNPPKSEGSHKAETAPKAPARLLPMDANAPLRPPADIAEARPRR